MNKLNPIALSFLVSLVYVGLGTISVLCLAPNPPLDGDFMIIILALTLPVNFISVGVMYADSSATRIVLIIQMVYFLIFWLIVYFILKRRRRLQNENGS